MRSVADDLTIFISCANFSPREQTVKETVNRLCSWSTKNDITFDPSKPLQLKTP